MNKRIAILGATSHIAKGLIFNFCRYDENELYLFARSAHKVEDFLITIDARKDCFVKLIDEFGKDSYDVIINCIGLGDPALLENAGVSIFELTETYDNAILKYLKNHRKSIYINFSSGAVYGNEFSSPAGSNSKNCINVNMVDTSVYYSIAKLNSEIKHRSYGDLRIIDLRIFAYFSRFINLKTKYLITEMIDSIRNGNVFRTGNNNIVRDYVGCDDLFSLVCSCIKKGTNDVYDVYSRKPVEKFEIIKSFHEKFGLDFKISKTPISPSITGAKDFYYSKNKRAKELGYKPKYTSLELLINETEIILNKGRKG